MAHDSDDVAGLGHLDQGSQALDLGGMCGHITHPDPLGAATHQGLQLLTGAAAQVALLVRDHHLVRSEEHTSELQSLMRISYAVFCLKKKKPIKTQTLTLVSGRVTMTTKD